MPFFPNIPNHGPPIAYIPTTSTRQPHSLAPIASTSSSEFGDLKDMMQVLMLSNQKLQDQGFKIGKKL